LLAASPDFAHAEPDAPSPRPSEVRPEPPPHPTGSFELGAGFSNEEGFIASAAIAQDNLFGTGDRLALGARISARRQLFDLAFEHRHLFGSTLSVTAELTDDVRHMYGFTREAVGGSLTLSQQLAPHVRGFVGYRLENIVVTPDIPSAIARELPGTDPSRGSRLGALRMGLAYTTLDTPVLPRRGTSIGSSVEIADRALGSQIQMMRTDAWISHHRAVGPLTLHVGGSVSAVSSSTPLSERLQFDGSSELRGFAIGELGPLDRNGMSLGGTFKYTARAELEVPLVPRLGLSAAGFVDAAGLGAGTRGWSGASTGFGLIWRSPFGPLRLDVAFPLDGSRPSFVFGLGGTL
jgi:outer membrane protein insertion porin family